MRLKLFFILIGFSILSGPAMAEFEWIYRDLKANTLPIPKCEDKTRAIERAVKPATIDRYTNRFCQMQGYGWHLIEVIENGNTQCNRCGDDLDGQKYSCYQKDIVVSCKRLKPGSAGMLPNELAN
jgi:hypothetical protein